MNQQQEHQDERRVERKEKQADERESERRFSQPGPTVRPIWFLVAGIVLVLAAVCLWLAI